MPVTPPGSIECEDCVRFQSHVALLLFTFVNQGNGLIPVLIGKQDQSQGRLDLQIIGIESRSALTSL